MTDITLLDGSIGQEAVKRSGDRATPLWSTSVMLEKPGVIEGIHRDYFDVGATIATTNTYAVLPDRLTTAGMGDKLEALLEQALVEAEAASDPSKGNRIAGSLGPIRASYRTDFQISFEDTAAAYHQLITAMDHRVDLFIIETVASLHQTEATLRATLVAKKPVWIAVTVDDSDGTILRSGEPLADLKPLIDTYDPQAVLINCSRPETVEAALEITLSFGRPCGAYANGFTRISEGFLVDSPTVDALEQRKDLGPTEYADLAMGWIAQGATIVGGCCEVGPDHIKELASRIRAAGHTIQ
ncbi:MAG: homocysteine S-methyltransferase family protein [Paracoccaceae bacterium]|nr:homocysteine S-methyltransferase family protein [Paracoccaceae bacterium]MDG2260140.1 homocysteine S-methyltransferase family protein [Paracoccaceae bacterium]